MTADASELKAGYDKMFMDNSEQKAQLDKAAADAAEFKSGFDKLLLDSSEQKAQVIMEWSNLQLSGPRCHHPESIPCIL